MKKLLCLLMCVCLLSAFVGCTSSTQTSSIAESKTSSEALVAGNVNVYGLIGPTGVGLAPLMKDSENGETQNTYSFKLVSDPQEIVSKIATGEADIAAAPTNLASIIYAKTQGSIEMIAVNTFGLLSILENGTEISTVEDLKGKTIYTIGQGSNPEYILRYVLQNNGIDPDKDVTIEYKSTSDEVAAMMAAGTAKIAMLTEPVVTTVMTKVPAVRKCFDMTDEWEKISSDSTLMMGCVIVRKEYLEKNPDAVKIFMQEYEKSINATKDVETTAALCEEYGIIPSAAIAQKAIPNCNIVFVAGESMKNQITGYFQVLFDSNPTSIGGAMPSDDFYYTY